jgi:hypothetical protein
MSGIAAALTDPAAREYALRIGVTTDGVINDLREGAGFANTVLGKLSAPGFGTVEKFNRTVAAHVGRQMAIDLGTDVARGNSKAATQLRMLNVDPQAVAANGGMLTNDQMIAAARKFVERSQFKVDPQDLPVWMDHPVWGKLFMQFKTFSYNQSAFMAREVIKPAIEGDVKPLLRFLILGGVGGAGATELRNLIANRPSEEDTGKRILQYYTRVGGFGLVGDLITAFRTCSIWTRTAIQRWLLAQ